MVLKWPTGLISKTAIAFKMARYISQTKQSSLLGAQTYSQSKSSSNISQPNAALGKNLQVLISAKGHYSCICRDGTQKKCWAIIKDPPVGRPAVWIVLSREGISSLMKRVKKSMGKCYWKQRGFFSLQKNPWFILIATPQLSLFVVLFLIIIWKCYTFIR